MEFFAKTPIQADSAGATLMFVAAVGESVVNNGAHCRIMMQETTPMLIMAQICLMRREMVLIRSA
jgi:hypothetical protein